MSHEVPPVLGCRGNLQTWQPRSVSHHGMAARWPRPLSSLASSPAPSCPGVRTGVVEAASHVAGACWSAKHSACIPMKMKENETSRKRYNFIVYDIVVGSNSGYKKSMEFKGIQGMFLNQSFWSDIFVPYPSHYSLIRLTQTSEIPDVFPGVHAGDLCCRQVESSQKGSAALSHPHTPPG